MSQSCFEDWIEDGDRPGGVGRSERQRVFWERVASGRPPATISTHRAGSHETSKTPESQENRERSGADAHSSSNSNSNPDSNCEGRWASAELAVVTMLTVVVFSLGWATFELESELPGAAFDSSFSGPSAVVPGDLGD